MAGVQVGDHQVGHDAVAQQGVEVGEVARLVGDHELLVVEQPTQALAEQPVGADQDDGDGADGHGELPLFIVACEHLVARSTAPSPRAGQGAGLPAIVNGPDAQATWSKAWGGTLRW